MRRDKVLAAAGSVCFCNVTEFVSLAVFPHGSGAARPQRAGNATLDVFPWPGGS